MVDNIKSEGKFGTGSFLSDMQKSGILENAPADEQARFAGGRSGCPIVEELIDDRSPEKMLDRYAEVNTWYKYITEELIKQGNPKLYYDFVKPVDRIEPIPSSGYEMESVPDNYTETMAPINTIYGFSLPRMLIDKINTNTNEILDQKEQLLSGLDTIEKLVKISNTPMELIARVAEEFFASGVSVDLILKQLVGKGWMDEHGAYTMMNDCKDNLAKFAPNIWDYYSKLSSDEKVNKEIL